MLECGEGGVEIVELSLDGGVGGGGWGFLQLGLVFVDGTQVLQALLQCFVAIAQRYGTTVLARDLGGCSSTELVDVGSNFRGNVLARLLNVAAGDKIKVLHRRKRR